MMNQSQLPFNKIRTAIHGLIKKVPKRIMKQQLLVLFVSLLLSVAAFISSMNSSVIGQDGTLDRNSYGDSDHTYPLLVDGLISGEAVPVDVTVGARRYTAEEAETLFQEILADIEGMITNGDDSVGAVKSNLNLPTHLQESGVDMKWDYVPECPEDTTMTDDEEREYLLTYHDLVKKDGELQNELIPENNVVSGYLSLVMGVDMVPDETEKDRYYSEPFRIYINVIPKVYTESERLLVKLQDALNVADTSSFSSPVLTLPGELDGKHLSFSEKADHSFLIFPLLGIVAAACLYIREESEIKNKKKDREDKLMLDYSELVEKLMVYIGAGLTTRNAFETISTHYDHLVEGGDIDDRPLFEELRIVKHQFERNIPEADIYCEFTRRINLKPYTKLCSLIEQNRKNGSKNLRALLHMEMEDAFETRKTTAKRLGEEAGTKLLLPLFILFGIVMLIIMVPALMAIG